MAIQKATTNAIKTILLSIISGIILGLAVGAGGTYKYLTLDHFKIYRTNIGLMVFVKDKIYNLSEMRSLDQWNWQFKNTYN